MKNIIIIIILIISIILNVYLYVSYSYRINDLKEKISDYEFNDEINGDLFFKSLNMNGYTSNKLTLYAFINYKGCKSCNTVYTKKINDLNKYNKNYIHVFITGDKNDIFKIEKADFQTTSSSELQCKNKVQIIAQPMSFLVYANGNVILSNMALPNHYDEVDKYYRNVRSLFSLFSNK